MNPYWSASERVNNQKQVFAQLRTPFWYELKESWADRIPVELQAGWNEVLVKVGKGRGAASGFYGFTFRVVDREGKTLPDLVANSSPQAKGDGGLESKETRFYRVDVPPGCVAVVPPKFHGPFRMLLNGRELSHNGDAPINIRALLRADENTLVLIAPKNRLLDSPVQFVSGETPFVLKSWSKTGLANFSGEATYSKTFALPSSYKGGLLLDLGRVSSVANVFVNGQHVDTVVWRPYRLDISKFVRPGKNEVKIEVTNTEANQRAVGTRHYLLPAIDVDGLEGPVRLVPYVDEVVALHEVHKEKQHTNGFN